VNHPLAARDRRASRRVPALIAVIALIALAVPTTLAASPSTKGTLLRHDGAHAATYRGTTTLHAAAVKAATTPHRISRQLPRLKAPRQAAARPLDGRRIENLVRPTTARSTGRGTAPTTAMPQVVFAGQLVVSSTFFAGLNQSDGGNREPPDSWTAVNGTYVIQAVNNVVRVSNRSGVSLQQIPDWAFFALPVGYSGSDTRVLWDQSHGRWIASNVSFDAGFTDNYIDLAVSETSDPFGVWDQFAFSFGPTLPDFPGLASSTDKVVITMNDYIHAAVDFAGAEFLVVDWSALLNPGSFTSAHIAESSIDANAFSIRPAIEPVAVSDVHLIFESIAAGTLGHVMYERVKGTGATVAIADTTDLTAALGVLAFDPPNPPRQSGSPATISNAVDERPTDAMWRNNELWFVSTGTADFGGGFGPVDAVIAQGVQTAASGAPTNPDSFVAAGDGEDRFMGGLGLTGSGDVILTYSKSSPSEFVLAEVASKSETYGISPEVEIDTSDGAYQGTRWGDYVGVAADPAGSDAVWLSSETSTSGGDWRTLTRRIISNDFVDPANPSSAAQPTVVVPGSVPSFTAPVRLTWGASTDAGSGIQYYELQANENGNGFGAGTRFPDRVPGTSVVRALNIGSSYQFRVRSVDWSGNPSAWINGSTFTPTLTQQTSATYSSGWSTASSSAYSGGSLKYSSSAGKYAQFTFSGRAVAFVTTKAISRGSVKVYIDGVLKATVSTYRSTTLYRQLVFQYSWSTAGTHKIKLVVVGTAGHPRVDVDAIVVLH
jgi:hypothetical protein